MRDQCLARASESGVARGGGRDSVLAWGSQVGCEARVTRRERPREGECECELHIDLRGCTVARQPGRRRGDDGEDHGCATSVSRACEGCEDAGGDEGAAKAAPGQHLLGASAVEGFGVGTRRDVDVDGRSEPPWRLVISKPSTLARGAPETALFCRRDGKPSRKCCIVFGLHDDRHCELWRLALEARASR